MPTSKPITHRRASTRNIGEEIVRGLRDIKAGRVGRRFTAESYPIVRAREKSNLTQHTENAAAWRVIANC